MKNIENTDNTERNLKIEIETLQREVLKLKTENEQLSSAQKLLEQNLQNYERTVKAEEKSKTLENLIGEMIHSFGTETHAAWSIISNKKYINSPEIQDVKNYILDIRDYIELFDLYRKIEKRLPTKNLVPKNLVEILEYLVPLIK